MCKTALKHNNIERFGTRTENFKQSFVPFCVNELCKLGVSLRKAEILNVLSLC